MLLKTKKGDMVIFSNNNNTQERIELMKIGDTGTFTDRRDGQTYHWKVMQDGKAWMTVNMNYKTEASCSYGHDETNRTIHGRLYTWKDAPNACPPGWHVPSYEEWGDLLDAINKGPEEAFNVLIKGGSSGFEALLGGMLLESGEFYGLAKDGGYWSSTHAGTSADDPMPWALELTNIVSIGTSSKDRFYSVRFVMDSSA